MSNRVAAGVLVRDRQVLLCHRSPGRRWYRNVWDLPGGHMEEGENVVEALVRELQEELGIVVAPPIGSPIAVLHKADLALTIFLVRDWTGDPVNRVPAGHDEIRWFEVDDVRHLALAHPALTSIIHAAMNTIPPPSTT